MSSLLRLYHKNAKGDMIYIIALNPAIDHILKIDRLRSGATISARDTCRLPRGKGMNVACAVAALDEKVRLIGFMGVEERFAYEAQAGRCGLEYEWVLLDQPVRQNVTLIETARKCVTHLRSGGFRVLPEDVERIRRRLVAAKIKKNDWVAFCGSLPQGMHAKAFHDLIQTCRRKTPHIVIDASGSALAAGISCRPYAIKPNSHEFAELLGVKKIGAIAHIARKAKTILERGISNVFVSLGEEGLFAANERQTLCVKAPLVRSVNTVGCGDAMLGGFLVGFARGLDFEEICRLGTACGAANAVAAKPGLISKNDVLRYLRRTVCACPAV